MSPAYALANWMIGHYFSLVVHAQGDGGQGNCTCRAIVTVVLLPILSG